MKQKKAQLGVAERRAEQYGSEVKPAQEEVKIQVSEEELINKYL